MTKAADMCADRVLDVRDLRVTIQSDDRVLRAVAGVSFHVDEGETLALVGESGAGKSITALSLLRLVRASGASRAVHTEGRMLFRDGPKQALDLLALDTEAMRSLRGRAISMIFQEPMTSLNPVQRIGDQIAEAVVAHKPVSWSAARARAVEMLRLVGIPDPEQRQRVFAHELSGGMRQRVMIAIALACRPRLLIADEPTTALDVTVQAQVLELIRRLQREFHMGVLFITHDLGVVAQMADRVAVMYAGRIVEEAPVEPFFSQPRHPYSAGLLRSMPNAQTALKASKIQPIPGAVPSLAHLPPGCAFHPRCERAELPRCATVEPEREQCGEDRQVSCFRWQGAPLNRASA
jgi:oligopeptide/dipeptide ABC transporter ATP-binding protein